MLNTSANNKKSNDLSKLLDISLGMIEKSNLSSLLGFIMEEAAKIMLADRSTLFLIDFDRNELISFIAQKSEIKEIRLPMGIGIAGHVARYGCPVNIEDAYKTPLFHKEVDRQTGYRTRTVLCVPMKNREGKITGVLEILNKKSGVFTEYDTWLLNSFAAFATTAIENARLHEDRERTFLSTIKTLAAVVDRRDHITAGHSERVAKLSVNIGKAMGLPKNELTLLDYAATMHDIGKVVIKDDVLLKPDKFSTEEREEMNKHAQYTKEILSKIYFAREYKDVPTIAAMHHERLDGTGYPYGLKKEQLNTIGCIIAVADVFDALMAFDRPYKKVHTLSETLDILKTEVEKNHLDAHIVNIFIQKKAYLQTFPNIKNRNDHYIDDKR
ncbi:MAG: HD domain-containing protein [Chloroflexi bacterium]|nr:HD domain-containing protein [Chloroflexota bacterium]MBM4067238.1 HD domain-containing protein [Planctomycetota bacterium]